METLDENTVSDYKHSLQIGKKKKRKTRPEFLSIDTNLSLVISHAKCHRGTTGRDSIS